MESEGGGSLIGFVFFRFGPRVPKVRWTRVMDALGACGEGQERSGREALSFVRFAGMLIR